MKPVLRVGVFAALLLAPLASFSQQRLSRLSDYKKFIDPLLTIRDFHVRYADDGASDATVLFPGGDEDYPSHPLEPVHALVRLGAKAQPLLIDCLSDGRKTAMVFAETNITKEMKVPVGYVCMDLLIMTTHSAITAYRDCSDDGMGACMKEGYYFRPDDYMACNADTCDPRPWVGVVQRNWRRAYRAHALRYRNPFDNMNL